MTVDILFVNFNRRAYAQASFQSLLDNTNWENVRTLHIHDDKSEDGAGDLIREMASAAPVEVLYESMKLGGPVASQNRHLDLLKETEDTKAFVKIDSDWVSPPGWLDELLRVSRGDPGCDVIGMQPRFGPPVHGYCEDRRIEGAKFIGGIGLMRYRMFDVCRPTPQGRYGWSEYQSRHPENRKGWILPDIAGFCLDLIDLEPWASLGREYEKAGVQRPWSKYIDGGRSYYEWWTA